MEDDKLAAYYDELTQKGEGAARFKQGLGFSSSTFTCDAVPSRGSSLPTTSSFLSNFVKASVTPITSSDFQKQAQLQSIQNKLNKKPKEKTRSPSPSPSPSPSLDKNSRNASRRSRYPGRDKNRERNSSRRSGSPDRHSNLRSRSQSRSPVRYSRRRSRSRSPDSYSRRSHRSRDRRSKRRSRSREDYRSRRKHQSRSRSRERDGERSRRRWRSGSPADRRSEKGKKDGEKRNGSGGGGRVEYTKLIEGYDKMTPAERVKAKMKLQLSETAEKDDTIGTGSGWERFDFNKDAPLDDEETEVAEDDAALVKRLGQSFRFSVVEARKEEEIKAAHDEAMFGAPSSIPLAAETDDKAEEENNTKENIESSPVKNLLSDQVLTMQQGSWRDRARKG